MRRASPRIGVGVGVAIGLPFRRVLCRQLLRLLDRRMRSRRVRFRAVFVGVGRRLDIGALIATRAGARRFDCTFVPRLTWISSHGVHPWSRS